MSTFREIFAHEHVVLPVVHVVSVEQTFENITIAQGEGADGVFLINHHSLYSELFSLYEVIRSDFPDYWIGINALDLGTDALCKLPLDVNGLWVDDAGVDDQSGGTRAAESFARERENSSWSGLYFGGVAFKYQRRVKDVALAAQRAAPFVDVITTSGEGTGFAPDIEKIRAMKKAIGEHPLGIASGITPENVHEYMPYANCFLVATGISDTPLQLNASRVRMLTRAVGN